MATLTLRGLSGETIEELRVRAREAGLTMNRYLVRMLEAETTDAESHKPPEHRDLDHLFGSMDEEEYRLVTEASTRQREVDPELWQ